MDDTAAHFLLRLTPSLTPIGTIRAYQMPGTDHYKLTRLAVLKDYRKYKFGRALVLTLHEWVRQHALQAGALGPVKLICHSQLPVKGFYAKFGYESEGDEFDEDGDPHQKMVFQMPLALSSTTWRIDHIDTACIYMSHVDVCIWVEGGGGN